MLCQICGIKTAQFHFKQIIDGVAQEAHMCQDCAGKKGFNVDLPGSVTDFIMDSIASGGNAGKIPEGNHSCPACRITRKVFRERSLLGCPECYKTFGDEINEMLPSMHSGGAHSGKIPVVERRSRELADLGTRLAAAIETQNFEEAAVLRDRIREIEAVQPQPEEAGR